MRENTEEMSQHEETMQILLALKHAEETLERMQDKVKRKSEAARKNGLA